MQPPSMRIDKQLERIVQRLPKRWQQMLVEFKAFGHGKKIKTPKDLLRAMLLYCGLGMSLREVAGVLTLSGARVTDEAVRQRLTNCADFLEAVVKEMLHITVLPRLPEDRRVLVVDGSIIRSIGEQGIDYRIHLCINLLTLQFTDVKVSDSKKGETLSNYEISKNDLVLADRGYCSTAAILDTVHSREADILLRWNSSNPLYESEDRDKSIDLAERLKDMSPGSTLSLSVVVGYASASKKKDKRIVRGWIHVYRMSETQANLSKRKTLKNGRKKQRQLQPNTVFLSQFVIVFTSLPSEILCAQDALALYRCRWQVELVIKRAKSLMEINKLRARSGGKLAKTFIYGKILYILLLDEELHDLLRNDPFRLDNIERSISPWRPSKVLRRGLDTVLLQQERWRPEAWQAALHVMMERPRRRELQRVPQRVLRMKQTLEDLDDAA